MSGKPSDEMVARRQARKQSVATLTLLGVLGLGLGSIAAIKVNDMRDVSDVTLVDLSVQQVLGDWRTTFVDRGSEGYIAPTGEETRTIQLSTQALVGGELGKAADSASTIGYRLARLQGSGAATLAVVEDLETPRGWGTFLYRPETTSPVVVEVTHPFADLETEAFGSELFDRVEAKALLLAGAHRFANRDGSADVAHSRASIFQTVHETLIEPNTIVIQPHGFEDTARSQTFGDIVVSSGTATPGAIPTAISHALKQAGFDVCLYRGGSCSALAGTTNVQKNSMPANAIFVHVELALHLRQDPTLRTRVIDAIAAALDDVATSG